MIDSSSYEDYFNILIEGLSKNIPTFNALSCEQVELKFLMQYRNSKKECH